MEHINPVMKHANHRFCLAAIFSFLLAFLSVGAFCEDKTQNPGVPLPVYLTELPNLNDYDIFANGGWDGSWYVGYNVCWIEQVSSAPAQNFRKAFIGAKIGREKTQSVPGKPVWQKEPVPGSVYIGVSSTPSWSSDQSYFLVDTADIPLDADPENAVDGVGESRWFWREVPLSAVSSESPNYLALWSPTPYFVSTASSPVLCGGWGSKKVNSWLNNDIHGYPPINPVSSLKTPITVFEPAIGIKLIPKGTEQTISVNIEKIAEGRAGTSNKTMFVSVVGDHIERAWIEVFKDNKWVKYSRYVYAPPFIFTIKPETLPTGAVKIRAVAADEWENTGSSGAAELMVTK
jgi:hypothetical protein